MSVAADKVAEVLALPEKDRAFLAHQLIASLDNAIDADAETEWNVVIDRRSREIEEGKVTCRPVEEVVQIFANGLMRVVSHPEADEELESAALWYEARQPNLGNDFLDEFERTLRRIIIEPERWRKIREENRKLNFDRFPYAIVYSLRADVIYIKAVMHLHRRPFYWQNRV